MLQYQTQTFSPTKHPLISSAGSFRSSPSLSRVSLSPFLSYRSTSDSPPSARISYIIAILWILTGIYSSSGAQIQQSKHLESMS
ncbi:hypothetical protein PVAP13_4NG197111 [Panicum virgatum]|uniref:Uncharacterized protein n=1 Tax=Panicum virgatum TaxID=38727 RepID=A0A8T0T9I2_PANVG|nr:hypothetical protein PVAP13_4NG197111 [Panicum virgatum]